MSFDIANVFKLSIPTKYISLKILVLRIKTYNMDKKQILENLVKHFANGNKALFARQLGIPAQTLSTWIARNTFDIELLYSKCEGISPSWLLTGEGDMFQCEETETSSTLDKRKMLNELIEFYSNGNKALFARRLGISPKTISTWLSRNTFDVELIRQKCPDVSSDWLLTGEGSMLYTTSTAEPPIAYHTTSPSAGIPLIPLSAMAGHFTADHTVIESECERYIIPALSHADFLITVKGISMYPRFTPGDIVACQRITLTDHLFLWNRTYVIDTTQGPLIKRIKPADDPDHVTLLSDNPDYDPIILPLTAIHALALVVGTIRLE